MHALRLGRRAQLFLKGTAGHVARDAVRGPPAVAPRLGGSRSAFSVAAAPPRARQAGSRDCNPARDAGSHGRSSACPGKRPGPRGRREGPGRRCVSPREGLWPRGAARREGPARSLRARRPRPIARPASKALTGRPKLQARRVGPRRQRRTIRPFCGLCQPGPQSHARRLGGRALEALFPLRPRGAPTAGWAGRGSRPHGTVAEAEMGRDWPRVTHLLEAGASRRGRDFGIRHFKTPHSLLLPKRKI